MPIDSQLELKPSLRKLGYFLPCQCVPESDIRVELPDSKQLFVSAELIEKQQLSPRVYRLTLQTATPLYYHAGQFINMKRPDGVIRSYSLASLPSEDEHLELHIKRMENGVMSNWLADELNIGGTVEIEGPNGHCFYMSEMGEQPLLLVGSGTGLAPLLGVLRDALHNRHACPINIYHGVRKREELYRDDELKALMKKQPNLHYQPCITGETPSDGAKQGRASEIALQENPNLKGWQVFLCGAPSMVKSMQQQAYLAGAAIQDIHADPFETKELRKTQRDEIAD